MRLIDADELRKQMYHQAFETDTDMQRWDSGCWIRYKMFENAIESAPTIDTVKHGRWVDSHKQPMPWDRDEMNPGCPDGSAYCSECGEWLTASDEYPCIGYYCPNCGAKMDGENDETY